MEKIVDNIGYALKDAADPASFKDEFMRAQKKFMEKLPTPEHFMQLIDSLKDITEEEKEKLKKNFAERAMNAEKFKELFTGKKSSVLPFIGSGYQEYVIFVGMVLLIVIVIGERICYLLSVGSNVTLRMSSCLLVCQRAIIPGEFQGNGQIYLRNYPSLN